MLIAAAVVTRCDAPTYPQPSVKCVDSPSTLRQEVMSAESKSKSGDGASTGRLWPPTYLPTWEASTSAFGEALLSEWLTCLLRSTPRPETQRFAVVCDTCLSAVLCRRVFCCLLLAPLSLFRLADALLTQHDVPLPHPVFPHH